MSDRQPSNRHTDTQSQLSGEVISVHGHAVWLAAALSHSPHPCDNRRSAIWRARLTISVRFHVGLSVTTAVVAAAYASEWGTASGIGCHGPTTETNAALLYVERRKYTAMLHISIGVGIGIGYWYRQWPILLDIGYWVASLVSF